MKQEPFFITNDYLEKNQKELEKVIQALQPKYQPPEIHKVKFMRELTLNLIQAQYRKKHKTNIKKIKTKQLLEKRKKELLEKLEKPIKETLKPIKETIEPIKQQEVLPPPPIPETNQSIKETKLQEYFKDQNVKEIICKGPDQKIIIKFLDNKTKTLPKQNKQELNHLIQDLAQQTNQEISPQKPFLASELNNKKIQANLGTDYLEPRFTIIRIE